MLFEHQKEVVESWVTSGMRGIFEMATGTGKTFAALECLEKLLEDEKKLIMVIACLYDHLVKQWVDDINDF
jgi:superfamily II DNA or RNA helicase